MTKDNAFGDGVPFLGANWFDPLEAGVRHQIRSFIEEMLESELSAALGRARYDRSAGVAGYRNGHRDRQLLGTFGPVSVSGPRARLAGGDGAALASQRNGTARRCRPTGGCGSQRRRGLPGPLSAA